jgi:hypothetical protein
MTLIDTADAYGPYTNEELDLPRDDFRRGLLPAGRVAHQSRHR